MSTGRVIPSSMIAFVMSTGRVIPSSMIAFAMSTGRVIPSSLIAFVFICIVSVQPDFCFANK
jgi:hypothetical protein